MDKRPTIPTELFVYECRGPRAPEQEPRFPGYLGLWPEPPFYYLFADRAVPAQIAAWVTVHPGWTVLETYQLAYEQWQQGGFETCEVGGFNLVKGDAPETAEEGGEIIRLHPGLVFGTGLHPTTQACLRIIGQCREEFLGARVTDLGTGTGVLAIACARLGASLVAAIDYNPMAVRETQVNICLNALESVVQPVRALGLNTLRGGCDWLIMNLEFVALCQVLQEGAWASYPSVLLSGFMPSQWPAVQRLVPPSWRLDCLLNWQGWCAALLRDSGFGMRDSGCGMRDSRSGIREVRRGHYSGGRSFVV